MKYLIASFLVLISFGVSNAASYQVTVNDADVPLLTAFLSDNSNILQGGESSSSTLKVAPLTPSVYLSSLIEVFMEGLRAQAKDKEEAAIINRAKNITPEEKAFIAAYEKLPLNVKTQIIKSVVAPSVAGHRGNHEHFDPYTGKSLGSFSDGN
jgi:hypothetical protein